MPDRTAKLVTGKARSYLRTSTVLFCLSLCLVSAYLLVLESQQQQRQTDFTDNATLHLIRVTEPAGTDLDDYLRFADIATVQDAVRRLTPSGQAMTTVVYTLGFGIPDQNGEPRFVYGLDGDGATLLGLDQMDDGTLYSTSDGSGELELQVPVVEVEDGGFSSAAAVPRAFRMRGGVTTNNPLAVLGDGDPSAVYTTAVTFQSLVQDVYGVDWHTFQQQFDRDNVFGSQVISDIYVDVPSLGDVRTVGDAISEAGYSTTYTLEAFDDLAGSLSRSAWLGLGAVAAAFLGCMAYVLLSLNSYLRVSHKDMAILRHAGFDADAVARMYAFRVLRMFGLIGMVTVGFQLALGGMVLRGDFLQHVGFNLLIGALLLGVVLLVAVRVVIPRHVQLDVLTLLKVGREFE